MEEKNNAIATSVNYMQVVPNSHYWTGLEAIINSIDFHCQWMEKKLLPKEPNVYYGESEMSNEHLLIGLNNCIKHGYKIKRLLEPKDNHISPSFNDINQMIVYVIEHDFETEFDYKNLRRRIQNTLTNGLDLTNGLKMDRSDVYKCINGERDYQDIRWNTNLRKNDVPNEEKPIAEWLNYIEYQLMKAKTENYRLSTETTLTAIRKIAALAVRCMEIHGCPERKQ